MGEKYFCTKCHRTHQSGDLYDKHKEFMGKEDLVQEPEAPKFVLPDNPEVQAVMKLPGVGKTTLEKLVQKGFKSLESIACTPAKIFVQEVEMGEKTAEKLVQSALHALAHDAFKTGAEILEKRAKLEKIKTGNIELDALLGGGIETGAITELYGEYRSGKTQICFQLALNAQLPKEQGGLNGTVVYIDTEGTFMPERLKKVAETKKMTPEIVSLKNIRVGRAYNSDHQITLVKSLGAIVREQNVRLIIIDSLMCHFRGEYVGRGTLADRQQTINGHLHDLQRLTDMYPDVAIVFTNQVSARPDAMYGANPIQATGGNIVAHGSTVRLYLRKGKDNQRIAKLEDAPHLPPGEAMFTITDGGIE